MESICRVFFPVLSGGCRFRGGQFQIQFWGVEVARCSIGVVRGAVQVVQNWFTEFRIRPKFEVRMRLPGLYRMSEDGVYLSSVFSCPFLGLSISKRPFPDPILGGRGGSL